MNTRKQQLLDHMAELAGDFSGTLGLSARGAGDLSALPELDWQGSESFPPASTIKVPLLVSCLRRVDSGELKLDDRIAVPDDEKVLGSGVLRDLDAGLRLTLRDLLMLMTIVSDNTATNLAIDQVGGPEVVNDDLRRWQCYDTCLVGKLMLPAERRNTTQRAGGMSKTTPHDLVRLMHLVFEGNVLAPTTRDLALQIMLRQHYTDSLTRNLPWPSHEPHPPWDLAAKSGSINGVRNQVGWIRYRGRAFYFALFTKGCTDLRYYSENEGNLVVARAFRLVFDYFFGA